MENIEVFSFRMYISNPESESFSASVLPKLDLEFKEKQFVAGNLESLWDSTTVSIRSYGQVLLFQAAVFSVYIEGDTY